MDDRRRQRRIDVSELMIVRIVSAGAEAKGQVIDLNNAGAFIATDLQVEANEPLHLELRIPGEKTWPLLKAVVARRTEVLRTRTRVVPAGLGVAFLPENVFQRAFIQKAVLGALKGSLEMTKRNLGSPLPAHETSRR